MCVCVCVCACVRVCAGVHVCILELLVCIYSSRDPNHSNLSVRCIPCKYKHSHHCESADELPSCLFTVITVTDTETSCPGKLCFNNYRHMNIQNIR